MRKWTLLVLIAALVVSSVTLAQDDEIPSEIEVLAFAGVESNHEWEPHIQEFDGVEMVLVPAGCFMMGSQDGQRDEEPIHEQCIEEPFWIDRTEVTLARYAECVSVEACEETPDSTPISDYSSRDSQPINLVTWFRANDYCAWRGASLPTEAEWEYAARGPDGLVYPWGDEFVADNVTHSDNSGGETADVGSHPGGASWVGALDMSGNLWEWTSTIYEGFEYPYSADDGRESNSDTDNYRVHRGGSLLYLGDFLRAADRNRDHPYNGSNDVGFRCARSNIGNMSAQDQDSVPVFAMIAIDGESNPYFAIMVNGMEDACAAINAQCQWLSPPPDTSDLPGFYHDAWQEALALEPDGIGTMILNPDWVRDGVESAAEQEIPVIDFQFSDPNAGTPDALPTLAFVGEDPFAGGVSNARRTFAEAAADGVDIVRGVCINHNPHFPGLGVRCDGVESVFAEEGVPLDRLDIPFGDQTPEEFMNYFAENLADYFSDNPETNAISVLGPLPAGALSLYFQEAGLEPRQLYATSFDSSPVIFQMIQDGYLQQTIDQQVYAQSYLTITWLYLNSQFALVPSEDIIATQGPIDASNLDLVSDLAAQGYR